MADNELKRRLCALMSVKSIVTVALTAVFAVLALSGRVTADQYMTVFSVVIAFYFGTQTEARRKDTQGSLERSEGEGRGTSPGHQPETQ